MLAAGDVHPDKFRNFLISNIYIVSYEDKLLKTSLFEGLYKSAKEMNRHVDGTTLRKVQKELRTHSFEELQEFVSECLSSNAYQSRFSESSNDSITELAYELLDIDGAGHIVYDMGSGNGTFLAKVFKRTREKGFYLKDLLGSEINIEEALASQMALDIISDGSVKPYIKTGNALEEVIPFTRAFVFPPLNMKKMLDQSRTSKLFPDIEFTNRNTSEWLFVDQLLGEAPFQFKAVALVSGRALFNDADKDFRNKLVQNGFLEAIIELPNGSLNFIGVKVYLLILSKGNKEVKLVDASNVLENSPKRFNKVELPVAQILDLYNNPNTPAKTLDELKSLNNLIPSSVLLDVDKPKNGTPLGELAEVFTGNQYTLGVFEKNGMLSSKPTGYRILTSSDIEDGVVDWKSLRSINYDDDKFNKYAVKKNDLVVTSKSSKVKTVVVDIEPKEKILVTGGMIIVRPDTKKLDPTYLKIFLDSEQGQNALKAIQKGSIIITINSKELSTILVPLIDLDKQIEKAQRYNEKLSTLYALKQEARKLEDALKNFYLDESEEE